MYRVMIFARGVSGVPAILLRETVKALAARMDMKLVAVCTPEIPALADTLGDYLKDRIRASVKSLFDPILQQQQAFPPPFAPSLWARKHDFAWIAPPEGDVNHPDFIAQLRDGVRPDMALSFYWHQKFSPELLAVLHQAVNYHNGSLPAYRGIKTTAWSMYNGEQETGFTFHRMDEKLDNGPILLEGTVPVRERSFALDLDLAKAAAAAKCIPRVLSMLVDGHPGLAQKTEGVFYSYKDYLSIVTVYDPAVLTYEETCRRLRAFGRLRIKSGKTWYAVTKVRRISNAGRPGKGICFKTSDGVELQALRFRYLPGVLYKIFSKNEKNLYGEGCRRTV